MRYTIYTMAVCRTKRGGGERQRETDRERQRQTDPEKETDGGREGLIYNGCE